MKTFYLSFALTVLPLFISAQVTETNLQLKYNDNTSLYECYLNVISGSGTIMQHRILITSQISLVVPFNETVEIVESNAPFYIKNTNGDTIPATWKANVVTNNDCIEPNASYVSINNTTSPTSFFGELFPGSSVKLFTFKLAGPDTCRANIRLFENGVDPSSTAPCMQGRQFDNFITLLLPGNTYGSNEPTKESTTIIDGPTLFCDNDIHIDITTTLPDCQLPVSYQWAGPAGYSSSTEDVFVPNPLEEHQGIYTVTVTDAKNNAFVFSTDTRNRLDSLPEPPRYLCLGDTLTLTETKTGEWSSSDPHVCSISPDGFINTLSTGDCFFIFTAPNGCIASTKFTTVKTTPQLDFDVEYVCNGGTTDLPSDSIAYWRVLTPNLISQTNNVLKGIAPGIGLLTYKKVDNPCPTDTFAVEVFERPDLNFQAEPICIGDQIDLEPLEGNWSIITPDLISIENNVLTALQAGSATFNLSTPDNPCPSDEVTIAINARPNVDFNFEDLCLSNSAQITNIDTIDEWFIHTSDIIVISNDSIFALAEGTGKLSYKIMDNNCISDTVEVSIFPTPIAQLPDTDMCIGDIIALPNDQNQQWKIIDQDILNLTGALLFAREAGTEALQFTSSTNPCPSTPVEITVHPTPYIDLEGDGLCLGSTITIPSNGVDQWANHTPTLIHLSEEEITAVTVGVGKLTFIASDNPCPSDTIELTIQTPPAVEISTSPLCLGEAIMLTDLTNNTWINHTPNVITIDSNIMQSTSTGEAKLTFSQLGNPCPSDTIRLYINDTPTVTLDQKNVCLGTSIDLPSVGIDTWTNHSPDLSVLEDNTLSPSQEGTVKLTFTAANNTCSSDTVLIQALPQPQSDLMIEDKCPSNDIILPSDNMESWAVHTPSLASLSQGILTTTNPGLIQLTFSLPSSICTSDTITFNVYPTPTIEDFASSLCLRGTLSLPNSTAITWANHTPDIISIDANDISSLRPGIAKLTFVKTDNPCPSDTVLLQVFDTPTLDFEPSHLCLGDKIDLPQTGVDQWNVLTPDIIILDGFTLSTISQGQGQITFEAANNPCPSDALSFDVLALPVITYQGDSSLCINDSVQLAANVDGQWSSSNDDVLSINADGLMTTNQSGLVTVEFISTQGDCISLPLPIAIYNLPNADIQIEEDTLIASIAYELYEWYDCVSGELITTTTSNRFGPQREGDYYVITYNKGCQNTSDCITYLKSSINDYDLNYNTMFYPNPSTGIININSILDNGALSVQDLSGRQLSTVDTIGSSIDLSHLSGGTYYLQWQGILNGQFKKVSKKMIIVR